MHVHAQPPPAGDAAPPTGTDSSPRGAAAAAQCVSYTAGPASPIAQYPNAVLSPILVADDLGPSVSGVEVRDLDISHPRVGALQISLHFLPYTTVPPTTTADLLVNGSAVVVLKDLRQGGTGQGMQGVTFTDLLPRNQTIPMASPEGNQALRGVYAPLTPLSTFSQAGLPAKGLWVLRVADMGEKWNERQLKVDGWNLVLCPAADASSAMALLIRRAQAQSAQGLDLAAATGLAASATSGAGSLAGLAGRLAPALGSLTSAIGPGITASTSVTVKSYSDLATLVVTNAISFINNVQDLFDLPYVPDPLINQIQPWVELLIGGSDVTLENRVWPGKIVRYALQLAVAIETASMMGTGSTGGTGATGSTGGTGSTGSTGAAGGTGSVAATAGNDGSSGATGVTVREATEGGTTGSIADDESRLNELKAILWDTSSDNAWWTGGCNNPATSSQITPGAAAPTGRCSYDTVEEMARASSDMPVSGTGWLNFSPGQQTPRRGFFRAPFVPGVNVPANLTPGAAVETFYTYLADPVTYDGAFQSSLDRLSAGAQSAATAADLAAQALPKDGQANKAAQAVSESAKLYRDIIRAGQQQLKKMNMEENKNKTQEFLKNGGLKAALDSGLGDQFIWNLERIRIALRFGAKDGPTVTYVQWLLDIADIRSAAGLIETLQELDDFQNGKKTVTKDKNSRWHDKANNKDFKSGSVAGSSRAMRPGETTAAWVKRITTSAEAMASQVFARVPNSPQGWERPMVTPGRTWARG